jgi:hypothetical protein
LYKQYNQHKSCKIVTVEGCHDRDEQDGYKLYDLLIAVNAKGAFSAQKPTEGGFGDIDISEDWATPDNEERCQI